MWTRLHLFVFLIVPAVLGLPMLTASNEPPIRLEKVTIHLFLENSGTLSEDITSIPNFAVLNFHPQGNSFSQGDEFRSFLIKVWLTAEEETYQRGEQARVVLKDKESEKVYLDAPIKNVHIGPSGSAVFPFLVSGQECRPLVLEVRGKSKSVTKMLNFECGE